MGRFFAQLEIEEETPANQALLDGLGDSLLFTCGKLCIAQRSDNTLPRFALGVSIGRYQLELARRLDLLVSEIHTSRFEKKPKKIKRKMTN
ncbi:MAG: hypothetical protein ACOX52_18765 [Verrucomicrobiota bacterium]